jgi:diguanylate cyclase (GGDEF)-like protein
MFNWGTARGEISHDRAGHRAPLLGRPFPLPGRASAEPSDDHWNAIVDTLDVAFQPIVNIHTGACYGYEALLRNVEGAGFESIADFLDSCHALGMLAEIEALVRAKALAKFTAIPHWRQSKLFLNLDHRLLDADEGAVRRIRTQIESFGMDESSVSFEISDRHPLGEPGRLAEVLKAYKRNNLRLAVDDFGTGFAGMQMLHLIEPEFLKIDRLFLAEVATLSKKKLFLSQIVNLAHLLGAVVVAEGVESEREYFLCKEIGCDLIQGHFVQAPTLAVAHLSTLYDGVEEVSRRERRTAASDQKIIGEQVTWIEPLSLSSGMELVFERFRADRAATFFPVVDEAGEPVGIILEKDLKGYAYSPYGKDLISNKAFGRKLKDFITRCPMADINTKAEHILQAYSAVERSEGILIVDNMKYQGFLSAHSLLRVINEKNLAAARDQNPLTKLPGNNRIHEYVSEALGACDQEVVLAYFDFDNFKPFNDKYGFRLGDRAILLFAELLAKAFGRENGFAGHVGGDDFFGAFRKMEFEEAEAICVQLADTFRRDVESFYDDETRRRGFITGQDRVGNVVNFPLMTVSAAVVNLHAGRTLHTVDEVSQLIAVLKKGAKHSPTRVCAASLAQL